MSLSKQHEMHKRRYSRNVGLGLVLGAFVLLIFGLTYVKITNENFNLNSAAEGGSAQEVAD